MLKHTANGNPEKGRPIKMRFPSQEYFRKGLELYGQQASRLEEPWASDSLQRYGFILVEGFNDVIRLDVGEIMAVGMMGRSPTDAQVRHVVEWSQRLAGGRVTVWCDNDSEGASGAKETAAAIAEHVPVLLAWSAGSFDGEFVGQQPESLTDSQLQRVVSSIEDRWKAVTRPLSAD